MRFPLSLWLPLTTSPSMPAPPFYSLSLHVLYLDSPDPLCLTDVLLSWRYFLSFGNISCYRKMVHSVLSYSNMCTWSVVWVAGPTHSLCTRYRRLVIRAQLQQVTVQDYRELRHFQKPLQVLLFFFLILFLLPFYYEKFQSAKLKSFYRELYPPSISFYSACFII